MSEPLLRIPNHHSPNCGVPPIIDGTERSKYVGYFANEFGEQWIFLYDRNSKQAELRGGDAGWNTAFEVIDGRVPGLNLGQSEQLWLRACWTAVQK